jgi:hypothetical protein
MLGRRTLNGVVDLLFGKKETGTAEEIAARQAQENEEARKSQERAGQVREFESRMKGSEDPS